jgi:hypothetical protein
MLKASAILCGLSRLSPWRPDGGTPYSWLVGVIEAHIEIVVVAGVHRDLLFHAREEVISSCLPQHEAEIKHTRLEDQ